MEKNKVKWGLKNVHAAKLTLADDNSATYGKPRAIPGAVNMSMDPEGEETKFRADNINYWIGNSNAGYSGDLEMALIPDWFKEEYLGYLRTADGVLVENVDAQSEPFALFFQFEGDKHGTRHVMYNVTAARPGVTGATTEETLEPETETLSLSSGSIYVPAIDKELAKASISEAENAAVYAAWFDEVYMPTALQQTYTVTFDSAGGSTVPAQTVISGQTATQPAAPTKGVDIFGGWTLNGAAYDFSTPVTGDITLVAQWTEAFTVTFDSAGGSEVAPQVVATGQTATEPADPTKGTDTFDGWFLNGTAYDFSTPVTGNITLVAQWS